MLSHINKRVKGQKNIALPLEALVEMYNSQPQPPLLVRNFAVVYVEMAAERATPAQRLAIVRTCLAAPLFVCLSVCISACMSACCCAVSGDSNFAMY